MSCCQENVDFCIGKGATFAPILRWATNTLTSKPITGISKAAPAVVTAVAHGLTTGWRAAVVSVLGMTQINSSRFPPHERDWHPVTVVSADTVVLDDVNSAVFQTYVSGGFLVYATPVSLTGCTAVMTIRDFPLTGTVLLTLTQLAGITLDNTAKSITPTFETATQTWTTGYYDLEITDLAGKVTQVATGTITIE